MCQNLRILPTSRECAPWRSERRLFLERRYHLHYIYENRVGVSWAHVSSKDMMHWQWPAVHAPRGLSIADFYADWAQANFGNEVARGPLKRGDRGG